MTQRSTDELRALDAAIGQRIRERRILLGLTQQQLAEMLGVTYQQLHKYERGINRISGGKLVQLAQVLCVKVDDLLPSAEPAQVPEEHRLLLETARLISRLDRGRQQAVAAVVRALANEMADGSRPS